MSNFKLGLQLYSVRDEMEKDMDACLKAVKEMGYELEDLMQIANMAVYEAIKTYSEYENAKFYTYVAKCIHNKLNTELRNNSSDKKKALNTAISYDANIPGTNTPLIDLLEDKTVINPYQYLDIKELKDKYIYYLNSLPFEVAGVYQLRLQGFNQSEIQTLLNINELAYERCLKTIKRRLTV